MTEKKSPPPVVMRSSHQMRPLQSVLMGMGLWFALAVISLYPVVLRFSGRQVGWAYLMHAVVAAFLWLTVMEARSWIGHSGGSYRIIRELENPRLAFAAGWSLLLGWASLLALFSHGIALQLNALLALLGLPGVEILALAGGIVLFVTLLSLIRWRPAWRIVTWIFVLIIMALIFAFITYISRAIMARGEIQQVSFTTGHLIRSVLLLTSSFFLMDFDMDIGGRRERKGRSSALFWLGGAFITGILLLVANLAGGAPRGIGFLFEWLPSQSGPAVYAGIALVASVTALPVLYTLMERRFYLITRDGWLPPALMKDVGGFRRPVLLNLLLGVIALAAVIAGILLTSDASTMLALAAAVPAAVLGILVALSSLALAKNPRAEGRSFRLPLGPIIPAIAAGLLFLMLFTLTRPAALAGAAGYLLGLFFYLRYGREGMRASQLGQTLFQDAQAARDITSSYPVVVAVSNPGTAIDLAAFGALIARNRQGHVMLLQVIQVPEHLPLDSARDEAIQKQEMLDRVISQISGAYDIQVEAVTRLSRSISQGIIDTVTEETARILVLGWGDDISQVRQKQFGRVIDAVIENAPCDVAIIRGTWNGDVKRILAPVSGGPNAPRAAEIGLKIAPELTLINIARQEESFDEMRQRRRMLEEVRAQIGQDDRVQVRLDRAGSPLKGILDAMDDYDALLMGVSEQGFLEQQWFSPLLLRIAGEYEGPIALIRSFSGMTQLVARKAWHSLADMLPTLNKEEQLVFYQDMRKAARPTVNYFVLIALSAVIATLGLLLNSPAVIIGAMLVAPLMSPIISSSVGIVFGDIRMLKGALLSTLEGVLMAIFIAICLTIISPFSELTGEILARTRPHLLDLLVALASGMAGAYALARKEVGEALPGVAIAAALMPPVCTVGIGIAMAAMGQASLSIPLGALLLFIANLAGIIVAALFVFLLLGIRPPDIEARQASLRRGLVISIIFLLVISIPLGWILYRSARDARIERMTHQVIETIGGEHPGAEFADLAIDEQGQDVVVSGILYSEETDTQVLLADLESRLEESLEMDVTLSFFTIEGRFYTPGLGE